MAITNIVDFVKELKKIPLDKDYDYFYRGHSDEEFELRPEIYRRRCIRKEDQIFNEILNQNPDSFLNEKTTLERLVKMHHFYGTPTRILNLTKNPLLALYFATRELPSKTGEVIIFKIPKKEVKLYDSDTVNLLANIAKQPFDFNYTQSEPLETFNQKQCIASLTNHVKEDKPGFSALIKPCDMERVVAVKENMDNKKLLKQNDSFLLFGVKGSKGEPAEVPQEWIFKPEGKDSGFKILSLNKETIKDDLDTFGFNKSALFPELYSSPSTYLKKLYR